MNSRIVLVVYRQRSGKESDLEKVVAKHLRILRSENLVTDREAIVMRSADGCIVEVFEWKSRDAIEAAHHNSQVLKLWDEFDQVCTYEKPENIAEFHNLFSEFQPI